MKRMIPFLAIIAFPCLMALAAWAQSAQDPFFPLSTATQALAVTVTASAAAALATTENPTWQEYVVNTGPSTAFLAFGGSAVAATTTSLPIPSGSTRIFTLNEGQAYVSAITATTTAEVYLTGGRGR